MKQTNLIIKRNGEITKYKVVKKTQKSGNGCAVTLPKELLNKEVYIEYVKKGIKKWQ